MARSNGGKVEQPKVGSSAIADLEGAEASTNLPELSVGLDETTVNIPVSNVSMADIQAADIQVADIHSIDDCLNALKILLNTVEKLQKVRLEVGDVKPFLVRMLDGEVMLGEELEQLKMGVGGLSRLIRAYSDHQTALAKAQPARDLLDQVLNYSPNQPE